jgi:hypothetical protein
MTGTWGGVVAAGAAGSVLCGGAFGQIYYRAADGTIDFAKEAFVDVTDPANWDILTDEVAITRGNS